VFADPSAPVVMVFGDSLVAGHGLAQGAAFPEILEQKLVASGVKVRVINAGVSGDTTAGGLARLDWSLSENPDAAIVVLGGNDILRGFAPETTFTNLDKIISRLREQNVQVMLAGMKAPRNFGKLYVEEFDEIYLELSKKHDLVFYPFFLEGVALRPKMNLSDGLHPNDSGIDLIASNILPYAKLLLSRLEQK
tara:strand:- start:519 stop:1097 length:579 start_codon:yes stop_codon:yes gene_type:complete